MALPPVCARRKGRSMNQTETPVRSTEFASPERSNDEELRKTIAHFAYHPEIFGLLDAVPDLILILNSHRQVVFANRAMEVYAGVAHRSELYGQRPGEILGCVHATEQDNQCGISRFCSACGAVKAILVSLAGKTAMEECSINQVGMRESFDLRVWGTPYQAIDQDFTIFAIRDIADEKRRYALEHTFFHDILNTAGGLLGYAELMKDAEGEDLVDMAAQKNMPRLANQLIEEIWTQRLLTQAERDEVTLEPVSIDPQELLEEVAAAYTNHRSANGRFILVDLSERNRPFTSDRALLARVLGSMAKNALEACRPGETATMGWRFVDERIEFWAHNPGAIPQEVQLQLFQRSFSTKGVGRGLGTYSMKLLGERYLQGSLSYESEDETGTLFNVSLPLELTDQ
jgi:signal transduction histidine kinase